MARIRTIKPEFWRHEDLSELPPETHMLAAALLNYADDEGYFNANPKLVKAACCPLREDSVNVHGSLISLAKIGYVKLGTGADGKTYGHVVTFKDHQKVSHPKPSKIKDMEIVWEDSVNVHGIVREASPPEGNREGNRTGKGIEQGKEFTSVDTDAPDDTDNLPDTPELYRRTDDTLAAVTAWNGLANELGLPQVQKLTETRRRKLRARLKDCDGLDGWNAALEKVRGIRGLWSGPGWKADFDFLVSESKFVRLMEGGYDDWGSGEQQKTGAQEALERMRSEA